MCPFRANLVMVTMSFTITIIRMQLLTWSFTLPCREPPLPPATYGIIRCYFRIQSSLEPPDALHFHRAIKQLREKKPIKKTSPQIAAGANNQSLSVISQISMTRDSESDFQGKQRFAPQTYGEPRNSQPQGDKSPTRPVGDCGDRRNSHEIYKGQISGRDIR